jgi:hypothetical protein
MNSGGHGVVVNDDLRMIDWIPDGDIKLRPRNYDLKDMARLQTSPDLFARKFDAENDMEILSLLERHLETPAANMYHPVCDRVTIDRRAAEQPDLVDG